MDIVMNHSGYNSLYDMAEYGYGTVAPGWEDSYYSHQNVNNKNISQLYRLQYKCRRLG